MQMPGTQVLFGFELQGLFQDNFESLPIRAHVLDAIGRGFMAGGTSPGHPAH